MDRSPFPFQGPLAPSEVTGRDDLRRDLAARMVERRVTALLGPRRYGKTSLLRRVTADLAEVGPETIWIDRSEEHTSELQSLMRNSYAVFCLNKKKKTHIKFNT